MASPRPANVKTKWNIGSSGRGNESQRLSGTTGLIALRTTEKTLPPPRDLSQNSNDKAISEQCLALFAELGEMIAAYLGKTSTLEELNVGFVFTGLVNE